MRGAIQEVTERKILLLDEVTSQVDLDSEQLIVQSLGRLGREYTLIMVTHRPALLSLADRSLTLVAGELR